MEKIQKKEFSKITIVAIDAAIIAGDLLKKGFFTKYKIDKKQGKHNLVTEYDFLSEKTIISYIKKIFPTHSFLSEECGRINNSNEVIWIIDPLDGTVNFAHKVPIFSVSIAAIEKNQTVSGVIYQPLSNELFVAEKNTGSFLNYKKIEVTQTKMLDDALLATGFPYNFDENPNHCLDRFSNILKKGLPIRRLGCASIDLAYVASGIFDAFWETGLGAWDVAAGNLLIEEAGGIISDFENKKFQIKDTNNALLASNKILHNDILKVLNENY
ncbi:MAG: Inositol-1-monophosphatase [Candidatus Anoxychlamydiales bacterium]|nr:Inositol-1-monophosphatase [Candidatus Anoxychlamydiales bacterium]